MSAFMEWRTAEVVAVSTSVAARASVLLDQAKTATTKVLATLTAMRPMRRC